MDRWKNLNQWMFDFDTFNHLYMWILLNAMYEGRVQLGCVVLGERQYIRSIGKFRETVIFKVGMRPYCMQLFKLMMISLLVIISIGWGCL